jgi:hypothetical protein
MANDPGLTTDTCIYMEAVTGDKGTHDNTGVWWLSPDIQLTGPISGPDKADPGQSNPVNVNFHRKADDCVTLGDESVTVELWVGNPSLAMAPNNQASTALIQIMGAPFPAPNATATQPFNWTPPNGLPASDPQSSGHKCLVARCYSSSVSPSATNFFVPDDQHVAQHNICIVPCGGPGAARRPGPCGLSVATVNLNKRKAETVTLRAVVDLKPNKFVRQVVLQRLEKTKGFRRLATTAPRGFKFELPDFPKAEVNDKLRNGYEAKIQLKRGQSTNFTFLADLSKASFGDAYIFHLTQTGADGHAQGGLTIVMIAV